MNLDEGDPRICWLGAFAMGLAVSSQLEQDRVEELVAASAGDRASLEAARQRLDEQRVGDPVVRRTAVLLLDAARAELEPIDLTTTEIPASLDATG